MAMHPNSVSTDAKNRDGCNCHPWAVCRHFGELVVSMRDQESPIAQADTRHKPDRTFRYSVAGPKQTQPCPCGEYERITYPWGRDPAVLYTNDLPSAQAEFDRRAEELAASG